VVVDTNQDKANHYKVGLVYDGRGLGRYTGLDKGYVGIIIYGATCDDIDEAIVPTYLGPYLMPKFGILCY
jgi:hypothetical protein